MIPSSRRSQPLAGLRVAVTVPPVGWFGSIDHKFAVDMIQSLDEMGANLFLIDIARLVAKDSRYVAGLLADLRRFEPDVALATPNAGYALLITDTKGRHLLRDILEVPTLLIWDHGVLQFCTEILSPLPNGREESSDGCIMSACEMRWIIRCSYTTRLTGGHTAIIKELGVLVKQPVKPFLHIAFPAYTRPVDPDPAYQHRIVFAGNLYLDRASHLNHREQKVLARIETNMLAAKKARPGSSLWELA